MKNICVIGAGTGQSQVLKAIKNFKANISSIINITDNGGNSGILKNLLKTPQVGDTRRCIEALYNESSTFKKLLNFRFNQGELKGVNIGNFILSSLIKICGNFELACKEIKKIENFDFKKNKKVFYREIIPVSNKYVNICALLQNRKKICGEWQILKRKDKSKIKKIFINPKSYATKSAINAILKADFLIISPGSLYTGILPIFLFKGIKKAIKLSNSYKIYIANIMSQPNATDSMTIEDHIKEIEKYSKLKLDLIIINSKTPKKNALDKYKKLNSYPLEQGNISKWKFIKTDLIEDKIPKSVLQEKNRSDNLQKWRYWLHLIRHSPKKLEKVLKKIIF